MSQRQSTPKVSLPGGQSRLKNMILYVAEQCADARYFGAVKLNKIIWKADFDSFAARGVPVTGREYLKQKFGPALKEMLPVQNDMLRDELIEFKHNYFGDGIVEDRTVAVVRPNMSCFTDEDMKFVAASIQHYWHMTGTESSDESHGIAWKTRAIGETMPYESALLSDRRPNDRQWKRLKALVKERQLSSA
jgi:hypothetical protein